MALLYDVSRRNHLLLMSMKSKLSLRVTSHKWYLRWRRLKSAGHIWETHFRMVLLRMSCRLYFLLLLHREGYFFPPHKHLVLVIPLITVHSVNSRLTDSSGCEKAAMSTRLTKGSSFSVISTWASGLHREGSHRRQRALVKQAGRLYFCLPITPLCHNQALALQGSLSSLEQTTSYFHPLTGRTATKKSTFNLIK